MSQIKPTHLLLSALLALALGGCGDKKDKVVFAENSGHPSDWVHNHKTPAQTPESCTECHGENYTGGISNVGCMSPKTISGFSCHATSPVANPTGCGSCHGGSPSGPFGITAPNTKSAHTKHTALSGIGCNTCHTDGGPGTSGHARATAIGGFSKAKVTLASIFSAPGSNGTFGYNAATGKCSSVSCHGGKTTPVWTASASINIGDAADPTKSTAVSNAICNWCHDLGSAAGQPQYNSYYSGQHVYHLSTNVNAKCTDCHNIGTLTDFQKHFGGIATNTLVLPSQTIGGLPTTVVAVPPATDTVKGYDPATTKCTTVCHPPPTPPANINIYQWIQ